MLSLILFDRTVILIFGLISWLSLSLNLFSKIKIDDILVIKTFYNPLFTKISGDSKIVGVFIVFGKIDIDDIFG